MDGENNGKPYFLMDDLGWKTPYFWKHPFLTSSIHSDLSSVPFSSNHIFVSKIGPMKWRTYDHFTADFLYVVCSEKLEL